MRALVVGGGIGGLSAGIALHRAGWDVQVLERAAGPGALGAGISLWPNALAALAHLAIWPDIGAASAMQLGGARLPDGRWLNRIDRAAEPPVEIRLVHRAQLHARLVAALPAGALTTGAEVRSVQPDGSVECVRGGRELTDRADLVVAADGVHSAVRARLWPEHPGPRYAGFTAWRGVTAEPFELDAAAETWGRGGEFGATILASGGPPANEAGGAPGNGAVGAGGVAGGGGRVYWFATANRPEGERAADEHAEVLRRFGGWHDPIARIVAATDPSAVLRHDICQLARPLPPFERGRVALLGDAAHAMTPNLGQGGCLAMEDAVELAALVRGAADADDVAAALREYDARRRPRTQRIAAASARAGRVVQAEGRLAVTLRNASARLTPPRVAARVSARATAWQPPTA